MSSADLQQLLAALQLNLVPGVGPRIQQLLCAKFGSPAQVLATPVDLLRQVQGVGGKLAVAIHDSRDCTGAAKELERCRELQIDLIEKESGRYPSMLAEICDAPNILYCRGTLEHEDQLAVAIVGSRRCTLYGRQQAGRLAGALAGRGITIISGLARGIDAAAHKAALDAGGRTIAVAATGLSTVYPPEHRELAGAVSEQGAIVSESRLSQQPKPGLFPQRNRIISGMSLGVVIVEAGRKSGALHTARHAMEQGREVFAVPGRIDNPASLGCHDLLRDGVTLVRDADDVLQELGPLLEPVSQSDHEEIHVPRELNLNDVEREILNHVSLDPKHIDEVVREAAVDASRVLSTITVLEMKRLIRRLPGGFLVRGSI